MKKLLTFAACLTLTAFLQSQTTIFVKPNGTGDGKSWTTACNLDSAVKNAVSGDQIWVQKGTYQPSGMLVIPASVKVYGGFSGTETLLSQRLVAANSTIVDGQHKIGPIFRLENAAELHSLIIQNGNANGTPQKNGGGVWADENCMIANCMITNNTAAINGGGVYANGKVTLINTVIMDNTAYGSGINIFGNCLVLGADQSNAGSGVDIAGCNPSILYLGEVRFKTQTTVPVTADGVTLTWSDAVIAEGCNKTTYYGGASGSYYSDCRANNTSAAYGDLFSWCAVARFAHVLCPAPWRVPTKEDFINLDKTMGGTGGNRSGASAMLSSSYIGAGSSWGGAYGGYCYTSSSLSNQSSDAYYWSQSESSSTNGYGLLLTSSGGIYPQYNSYKHDGFTLRCVR